MAKWIGHQEGFEWTSRESELYKQITGAHYISYDLE